MSYIHSNKKYITCEECLMYVHKVGLRTVSDVMIASCYAESMMTVKDTIRDPTRMNQMSFVEFVVFICRICHEAYTGTPYHSEKLYLKIDKLMEALLAPNRLAPHFTFGDRFKYDIEEELRKNKRKLNKLKKSLFSASSAGHDVSSLEKEIASLQDKIKAAAGPNYEEEEDEEFDDSEISEEPNEEDNGSNGDKVDIDRDEDQRVDDDDFFQSSPD